MQLTVADIVGLSGVPCTASGCQRWLKSSGICLEKTKNRLTFALSDLPPEVRRAVIERDIAAAGLPLGTYDEVAHQTLAQATPKMRDVAERKAAIARDLMTLGAKVTWAEKVPYEFTQMTASNDEHVFKLDEYVFGMRARANAGFGLWQLAWGSKQTLNAANYGAARAAMMGFKADGGKVLGVKPTVLVVPPSLEEAARNIVNSATGAAGATNPWANTAELIVSPYLA